MAQPPNADGREWRREAILAAARYQDHLAARLRERSDDLRWYSAASGRKGAGCAGSAGR